MKIARYKFLVSLCLCLLFVTKVQSSTLHGVRYDEALLADKTLSHVRLKNGKLSTHLGKKILAATALVGAEFTGELDSGNTVKLKIEKIFSDPHDADLVYYQIHYQQSSTGLWFNACLPDYEGKSLALLFNGVWDRAGNFHKSQKLFTVGCTVSAIGKCAVWGYKPWQKKNGHSLKPWHQACTRMVRADYLGNGDTHTRDGTEIFFTDTQGIHQGHPPQGMTLEAGWCPDGAVSVAHFRFPDLSSDLPRPKDLTKNKPALLINYSKPR